MNLSDSRHSILASWLRNRGDLERVHEDKKRFRKRTGHLTIAESLKESLAF
jgi:hypothetical protein